MHESGRVRRSLPAKCLVAGAGVMVALMAPAGAAGPAGDFIVGEDCARIDRAELPTSELVVTLPPRRVSVTMEVARTPAQVTQGMMCRERGAGGMLFEFDTDEPRRFWMFNTYLALDVIYLDRQRRAVGAATMAPCPRPPGLSVAQWDTACREASQAYTSPAPARYVIELPAGWLAERGFPLDRTAAMRFRWQARPSPAVR